MILARNCLATLALITFMQLHAAEPWPSPFALPSQPELPDLLRSLDGTPVKSAAEWRNKRRPELKELFQHYMYGTMPPAPKGVKPRVIKTDAKFLGGKATLKIVEIPLAPGSNAPVISLMVLTPNSVRKPAPAFLGINFNGNHEILPDSAIPLPQGWVPSATTNTAKNVASEKDRGRELETWAVEQTLDRGYAFAGFYVGDVEPDQAEATAGIRSYFRKTQPGAYDWGTIAAWAWGLSRAMDYLVTDRAIDGKRVAVTGHSRNGKASMLAAAMDERFALVIPLQAGCGGTSPSRGKIGESVKRINEHFPHWFNSQFRQFNDAPERIPFDQHGLVALCAPRPVLFSNAVEDSWANPDGQFEVLKAAEPVYQLLNVKGLGAVTVPGVNQLLDSRLGYFIRPGKHSMTGQDWGAFLDFADKWLK